MSTEPTTPPLVMLGAADAAVCEDDSCLLPGADAGAVTDRTDRDASAQAPRGESQQS